MPWIVWFRLCVLRYGYLHCVAARFALGAFAGMFFGKVKGSAALQAGHGNSHARAPPLACKDEQCIKISVRALADWRW
jgi:hypothetical protein